MGEVGISMFDSNFRTNTPVRLVSYVFIAIYAYSFISGLINAANLKGSVVLEMVSVFIFSAFYQISTDFSGEVFLPMSGRWRDAGYSMMRTTWTPYFTIALLILSLILVFVGDSNIKREYQAARPGSDYDFKQESSTGKKFDRRIILAIALVIIAMLLVGTCVPRIFSR